MPLTVTFAGSECGFKTCPSSGPGLGSGGGNGTEGNGTSGSGNGTMGGGVNDLVNIINQWFPDLSSQFDSMQAGNNQLGIDMSNFNINGM